MVGIQPLLEQAGTICRLPRSSWVGQPLPAEREPLPRKQVKHRKPPKKQPYQVQHLFKAGGTLEYWKGLLGNVSISRYSSPSGVSTLKSTKLLTVLKTSNPVATFLQKRGQGGPKVSSDELAATLKEAESISVELQKFVHFPSPTHLLESILPSILLIGSS
jgi:hypothetical protein